MDKKFKKRVMREELFFAPFFLQLQILELHVIHKHTNLGLSEKWVALENMHAIGAPLKHPPLPSL